jgi:lipopolysaccharide transport system ATP-binding protein
MSDIAIRVENLGKQYRIGALQKNGGHYTYKSLRDSIASAASAPFRAARALMGRDGSQANHDEDTIWALKDVSFDVKHGDIVGVIGRNGAGKSTLLKILSRITEPTTGHIEIRGRVGSLLEVGTGFHPELTGRDNVYLNGSILGMKNAEIAKNFDAIVAFAEVEKFIDTPVKHYSSGMYLRLAFAVAAHLQTEILLVDEVLAVGDAAFQRRCLGKMSEVASEGRTVFLVSHNLAAVENLCASALWISSGRVTAQGSCSTVLSGYIQDSRGQDGRSNGLEQMRRSGNGRVKVTGCWFEDENGCMIQRAKSGEPVIVAIEFQAAPNTRNVDVGVSLSSLWDQMLFVHYSSYVGQYFSDLPARGVFRCVLVQQPLSPGDYQVGVRIVENASEADWPRGSVATLEIVQSDFYGTGHAGFSGQALLLLDSRWTLGNVTSSFHNMRS